MATTSTRPQLVRSASSNTSISRTRDKPRLYIALYPRGGSTATSSFRSDMNCDSYHWSVVVGSQAPGRQDPGTRYHVVHPDHDSGRYFYDEQDIPSYQAAQTALVRIAVAKVTNEALLKSILRDLAIRQDDTAFNCLTWVREAFIKLHDDGKCIKSYLGSHDWAAVEACARKYCKRKRLSGRFQDGRDPRGAWNVEQISTFNFWENRETCS